MSMRSDRSADKVKPHASALLRIIERFRTGAESGRSVSGWGPTAIWEIPSRRICAKARSKRRLDHFWYFVQSESPGFFKISDTAGSETLADDWS